jgi:hypothetical protein
MAASPTASTRLGYPLFDADNHYYEPRDCFSRFIEPRHRDKAIHVVKAEIRMIMRDNALGLVGRA